MDAPRILIVEDDEALAFEVGSSLASHGYEVVGRAASCEKALDLAQRLAPSLALVDVELDGPLDGVEVARRLRQRAETAVVYVTGHSDRDTVERAKATAPVAYLMKPFSERELMVTVELALVRQQLQRTERLDALGVLAGGLAHDFNNLLAVIGASVSFARRKLPAEERTVSELLQRAVSACERAGSLTKQLLTFASGGAPIRRTVELGALIRSSAELALHAAPDRVSFDIPREPMHADVDEGQIAQVLINLVTNALEAMPNGGVVEVRCANLRLTAQNTFLCAEGPYVEVAITDHGAGIAPEILDRIFEPYFSTKQRGSGLGLAVAHSIAKQHGGALVAEAAPDGGATFRLLLPAAEHAATAADAGAPQGEPTLLQGLRVLVMDDEDALLQSTLMVLRELGCDVEGAADGAEALRLFQRARELGQPFDVVILDLTVRGGVGGLETVQQLLAIDPGTRAIATSGYAPDPILGHPERYGFVASLPKPYPIDDLGTLVRRTARRP